MAAKFGPDHNLVGTFLMFLLLQPFAAMSRTVKPESLQNLEPDQHRGCGVSNVIDQMTFNGVDNYKYFPGKPKWMNFPVTYGFVSTSRLPAGLNSQAVNNSVAAALKVWEAEVPKFAFKKVDPGENANIKIEFTRISGGYYGYAWSAPNGTLLLDNVNTNWSTGSTPATNQLDLQSGVMHEIGHTLGLDHTTVQSAVMNDTLIRGTLKRSLAQDDKDAIQNLYT